MTLPLATNGTPVVLQEIRTQNWAQVLPDFTVVDSIFGASVIVLMMYSDLDQPVNISFDGSTWNMLFPSGGTLIVDWAANGAAMPKYMGVYTQQSDVAPTSGNIYVTTFSTGVA